MTYFVFDNPSDKSTMQFIDVDPSLVSFYPEKKLEGIRDYIRYSKQLLKTTNEEDILIFWYDFSGIVFDCVRRFYSKKRKTIMIKKENLMKKQ